MAQTSGVPTQTGGHTCISSYERHSRVLGRLQASLSTVDLDAEDSKLVLLGDYCDRGPDSLGVFELVMDLQKRYGDRVVALRGNHEEMFLEYIDEANDLNFTQAWILADSNLATAKSFLDAEAFSHVNARPL